MKEFIVTIPSSTSADAVWCPVYEKMTLIGAFAVTDAIPGAETVVSLKSGSTTLGTITLAADSAVGEVTAAVMSTTLATRKTALTAAIPLQVSGDGGQTTATGIAVVLRFDEFALTKD